MQGQAEQGNYSGQGQQRLSGGPSLWPEHQVKTLAGRRAWGRILALVFCLLSSLAVRPDPVVENSTMAWPVLQTPNTLR